MQVGGWLGHSPLSTAFLCHRPARFLSLGEKPLYQSLKLNPSDRCTVRRAHGEVTDARLAARIVAHLAGDVAGLRRFGLSGLHSVSRAFHWARAVRSANYSKGS